MEGNKLEISGKEVGDPPHATYKPIPAADDAEEIPLTRPKTLTTSKSTTPEADGADEKMLPNEDKKISPNSNINAGDVKFVLNEKQNGDAKLDIGEIKNAFVGMGKEELMKYANDPFWVRLRWFLFISFWLLWAGMLAGAILIIVAAPKCSPPEPRTWWEQGPLTEVQPDRTPDDLKSLKEKGVQGIIVPYTFGDIYQTFGNISEDFLALLSSAKKNEVNVIIDLNPGTSTLWFEKSEGKDDEFNEYYIWRPKKTNDENGKPIPPNNWLSTDNNSSWNYSTVRQEFYLSHNSKPQLNFRNPNVVMKFSNVLTAFLDAGVQGVRLKGASGLLVDRNFADEEPGNDKDYVMSEYLFWSHSKTTHLSDLGGLLKQWKDIVKNKTDNGPFFISDELPALESYKVNGSLSIDLPKHSHVFSSGRNLNASLLKHNLESAFILLEKHWPLWERSVNNIPADVKDYITFLLPGTTLINNDHEVDKELLNLRKSPSIMYGNCTLYEVANKTVFAFIRVAAGNPGYLIGVNPSRDRISVDFKQDIDIISEDVTVQFVSKNYSEIGIELKLKANARNIPISPESAIVLTYVPKSES